MVDGACGVSQHCQEVVLLDKDFVIIHTSVDTELIAEGLMSWELDVKVEMYLFKCPKENQ